MIKIGCSVLDAEFESTHAVVSQLIEPLKDLLQNLDVYITTGGGPAWDVRKNGVSVTELLVMTSRNLPLLLVIALSSAFRKNSTLKPL